MLVKEERNKIKYTHTNKQSNKEMLEEENTALIN